MNEPQASLILPGGEFPTTIHIMNLATGHFSVSSPLPQETVRPLVDNLFQVVTLALQDQTITQGPQESAPESDTAPEESTPTLPDAGLTPATARTPEADTSAIRAVEVAVPTVVDLDHWDAWCQARGLDANLDPRTHGHLVSQYQQEARREH